MTALSQILDGTMLPAGIGAVLYAGTVTVVALTAALARDPSRRQDACKALAVLLRRKSAGR
ncbi:hypothetical protein [Streptomyces shenzhenensis]|uniref:hypothetical protein n=1 Tax=Streptomyces shenzhenensis TaxID=943815 RepID=UPI001F23450D|nr:hypothetical protein [Streptomyces shenzhenensis]